MDLNSMRGFYAGQSCFLICDGPSFKAVDKDKLNAPGIVTMGVNNAPSSFRTNMWCFIDNHKNFIDSLKIDGKIIKFCPYSYAKELSNPFVPFVTNTSFCEKRFLSEPTIYYGNDKDTGGGRSIMLAAIKILYLLGFKNVFLLGVDFKMVDGGENYHFEQDTNKHMVRVNNNTYKKLIRRFELLKPIFESNDFNIYNCNPDSELRVFPYVSLDDAIKCATSFMPDVSKECTKDMYKHHRQSDRKKRAADRVLNSDGKIIVRSKNQICISGISRSGTHAVADWICSQLVGNVQYRNDLKTNPMYLPSNADIPERFYTLPSLTHEVGSEKKPIDYLVYSYENMNKENLVPHRNIRCPSEKMIQLLRDPYNLLASLATHIENGRKFWFWRHCTSNGKITPDKLHNFGKIWEAHANIFLNQSNVIGLSYNKWAESKDYRDELFERIGLNVRSDKSMDFVPQNGGGSSFDKRAFDGNAREMDTSSRWKKYENEEWFNLFFDSNKRIVDLSNQIFGEIRG